MLLTIKEILKNRKMETKKVFCNGTERYLYNKETISLINELHKAIWGQSKEEKFVLQYGIQMQINELLKPELTPLVDLEEEKHDEYKKAMSNLLIDKFWYRADDGELFSVFKPDSINKIEELNELFYSKWNLPGDEYWIQTKAIDLINNEDFTVNFKIPRDLTNIKSFVESKEFFENKLDETHDTVMIAYDPIHEDTKELTFTIYKDKEKIPFFMESVKYFEDKR